MRTWAGGGYGANRCGGATRRRTVIPLLGLLLCGGNSTALEPGPAIPVNGKPEFLLGANYGWHKYGADLDEPDLERIRADFADMEKHGVRLLRWWLFANGHRDPREGPDGALTVGPRFYDNMRTILGLAQRHNVLIEWSVLDFHIFKRGRGDLVGDPARRRSFLEDVMKPLLMEFGDHPAVFAWDAMNEPDWAVRGEDGGDAVTEETLPLQTLRDYVNELAALVHEHTGQYATVGCSSLKWLGMEHRFWNGLDVDFYEAHYYGWMKEWFDPLEHPYASLGLDKPCLIGEFPGDAHDTGRSVLELLQGIRRAGYAGALAWMWTGDGAMNADAFKPAFLEFRKSPAGGGPR